jgi:hypothetical protein
MVGQFGQRKEKGGSPLSLLEWLGNWAEGLSFSVFLNNIILFGVKKRSGGRWLLFFERLKVGTQKAAPYGNLYVC